MAMRAAQGGWVRGAALAGLAALVLAAWWMMVGMAEMSGAGWLGRPAGPGAPMPGYGGLFAMWSAMMAAMMLPTLGPTLTAYEDLMRRPGAARVGAGRAGWLGLLAGYFAVWLAMAALLAAAQALLARAGAVDALGRATSLWLAAALLLGAGAFQFTRAKAICQGVCLAPAQFFLGRWRGGAAGGVRMGAGIGGFCAGCCWAYMALGFVGGVMSLAWMVGATALMVLEKLPRIGQHLRRPVGAALLAGGGLVAARAAGL